MGTTAPRGYDRSLTPHARDLSAAGRYEAAFHALVVLDEDGPADAPAVVVTRG